MSTGVGGEYAGRVFVRRAERGDPKAKRLLVSIVGSGKVFWRNERQWRESGSTPFEEFKRDYVRLDA